MAWRALIHSEFELNRVLNTLESTSIRYWSDVGVTDWCLIDGDPRVYTTLAVTVRWLELTDFGKRTSEKNDNNDDDKNYRIHSISVTFCISDFEKMYSVDALTAQLNKKVPEREWSRRHRCSLKMAKKGGCAWCVLTTVFSYNAWISRASISNYICCMANTIAANDLAIYSSRHITQ